MNGKGFFGIFDKQKLEAVDPVRKKIEEISYVAAQRESLFRRIANEIGKDLPRERIVKASKVLVKINESLENKSKVIRFLVDSLEDQNEFYNSTSKNPSAEKFEERKNKTNKIKKTSEQLESDSRRSKAPVEYYIADVRRHKTMTDERKGMLAPYLKEASEARRGIFEGNLRLVVGVAGQFVNKGLSMAELLEVGNEGLESAINRHTVGREGAWEFFAQDIIKERIQHAIDIGYHPRLDSFRKILEIEKNSKKNIQEDHGLIFSYMDKLLANPSLTKLKQERLFEIIQNTEPIRDEFLKSNLRLVLSIARRYQGRGLELGDLINEGNVGLAKAVDNFDENRAKFSTLAVLCIRQAIKNALYYRAKLIRRPVYIEQASDMIAIEEQKILAKTGEMPSTGDLANSLELESEKIMKIKNTSINVVSLDAPLADGENELYTIIPDGGRTAEEKVILSEQGELFRKMIDSLNPLERKIIREHFYGNKSLAEIGRELGYSRERMRKVNRDALIKLKVYVGEHADDF